MGAMGDIGGVLMDKQSNGSAKTLSSASINMTVMKLDQQTGSSHSNDRFFVIFKCFAICLIVSKLSFGVFWTSGRASGL